MADVSDALRIDDVSIRLGGRPVLDAVRLEVRPGEVVGILGPNGAGKTTLLRIAAGTLRPDRGDVWLGERRIHAMSERERARQLAVVPQSTTLPFPFRVGELVLMGRAARLGWLGFEGPADLAAARAALERVGIAHLADRSVLEISGGERQLAVVARALAQEPATLLLDEPTAFLDLRHRLEVLAAVREHAAAGGSALLVSHDLGLVARDCDRLVLLAEGRAVAQGTPAEVLAPEPLRRVFGIEATVIEGPDGRPLVVPRAPV